MLTFHKLLTLFLALSTTHQAFTMNNNKQPLENISFQQKKTAKISKWIAIQHIIEKNTEENQLHHAALNGDLKQLKEIIEKHKKTVKSIQVFRKILTKPIIVPIHTTDCNDPCMLKINKHDTQKITPIGCAVASGNLECIKFFIEQGIDVSRKTEDDESLLHIAVENNDQKCIELLEKHGADLTVQDNCGNTLLHHAVLNSSLEFIKFLAKKEPELLTQTNTRNGSLPLHNTISREQTVIECIELLVKLGTPIDVKDKDGKTLFDKAIKTERLDIVKFIIKADPQTLNIKGIGSTILEKAINCNNVSLIKKLFKTGFNLKSCNDYGYNTFHQAILSESLDVAECLISLNQKAIKLLIENDMQGEAKILQRNSFTPEEPSNNQGRDLPIHLAVKNQKEESLEWLLMHGAQIDAQNYWNETPLHMLSYSEKGELSQRMITWILNWTRTKTIPQDLIAWLPNNFAEENSTISIKQSLKNILLIFLLCKKTGTKILGIIPSLIPKPVMFMIAQKVYKAPNLIRYLLNQVDGEKNRPYDMAVNEARQKLLDPENYK